MLENTVKWFSKSRDIICFDSFPEFLRSQIPSIMLNLCDFFKNKMYWNLCNFRKYWRKLEQSQQRWVFWGQFKYLISNGYCHGIYLKYFNRIESFFNFLLYDIFFWLILKIFGLSVYVIFYNNISFRGHKSYEIQIFAR